MAEGIIPTIDMNGGSESGMGAWWVVIIIAVLFGGFGGYGRGHEGVGNEVDFAEINGRFNSIENQISNVNDLAQLRDNYKETCETNMNVTQQAFGLSKEIMQNRFDSAIEFKNAELRAADCCCTTNRNIDSVRFEAAQNTTALIMNQNENTSKILDKMCQSEIQTLRDKLADYQLKASQCAQNEYLLNQLRPSAIPAYPSLPPYSVVNPAVYNNGCCGYTACNA